MVKLYDISDWCRNGYDAHDYPYIGTVDVMPKIGAVLDIDGQHYTAGLLSPNSNEAGVKPCKINKHPKPQEYKRNIICPYCGYRDGDSWERSDDTDTIECGHCGGTIEYERIVTVEYTTTPAKAPEVIQAHWMPEPPKGAR